VGGRRGTTDTRRGRAIDGKTLRDPFKRLAAASSSNGQCVGDQQRCRTRAGQTEEKSNEITAIPRLLKLLNIKAAVTIDAMGCQKQIAADIQESGADYLLAVKDNQPTLNAEVTGSSSTAGASRQHSA